MWIHKPFFKYATGVLLVVIIIFFLGKIDYFLEPFQLMIAAVFFPVLIAGVLYYLLRSPVWYLSKYVPKVVSISIILSFLLLTAGSLVYFFHEPVANQVQSMIELAPEKVEEVSEESQQVAARFKIGDFSGEELRQRILDYINSLGSKIFSNISSLISAITNIVVVIGIVPFLLFFFLKDDEKMIPYLLRYLPKEHTAEGEKLLKDVDTTIFSYIIGQFMVALTDGVLMYIGYLIIGIDFAFTLALIATFLVVIPFLGPILGILPALFVALMNGPLMVVSVLLVLGIVQLLEGNLVTPNIMGKQLKIHPLTIIFLLLLAGSLYGFIGVLIAIPVYAIVKTLLHNFRLFYRLRRKKMAKA